MRAYRTFLAVGAAAALACSGSSAVSIASDGRRSIAIEVGASGYTPAEVVATPGEDVRLVFTRTSDDGCGQVLVFPALALRADLPLGEAVPVDVTMPSSGALEFTCGMGMLRGAVVAR